MEPDRALAERAEPQRFANTAAKPLPAVMAFVRGWLLPASTARRQLHVGLLECLGVHLLSLMLLPVVIAAGASIGYGESVFNALGKIVGEIVYRPAQAALPIACVLLIIEIIWLTTALLLVPWGAVEERLRSSFRHSVRCCWLASPHLLVAAIPLAVTAGTFDRWRQAYYSNGLNSLPYDQRPIWLVYSDDILIGLFFGLLTWLICATMRAVGCRANVPRPDAEPICQRCGYNLHGADPDGRCPECGEPVGASVGPQVRPGSVWEHRRVVGCWKAWKRCTWQAMTGPYDLGRSMRLYSPHDGHRSFLLTHLLLVSLCGGIAVLGAVVSGHERGVADDILLTNTLSGAFLSGAWVLAGVLALLLIWGVLQQITSGTARLPVLMRVAAYSGGVLSTWAAINLLVVLAWVLINWLNAGDLLVDCIADTIRVQVGSVFVGIIVLVNLKPLVWYVRTVRQMWAGARFADK